MLLILTSEEGLVANFQTYKHDKHKGPVKENVLANH